MNLEMINKIYNHFILIDKCAEETRIVEIFDKNPLGSFSDFVQRHVENLEGFQNRLHVVPPYVCASSVD